MPEAWAPSPETVKALIPARIQGLPFSVETTPSIDQVQGIIDATAADLRGYVGEDIPADQQVLARSAVAYATAAQVERSFWPEQNALGNDNAPALYLETKYESLRDRLTKLVGDLKASGDTSRGPQGSFPEPNYPVEREVFEPLGREGW